MMTGALLEGAAEVGGALGVGAPVVGAAPVGAAEVGPLVGALVTVGADVTGAWLAVGDALGDADFLMLDLDGVGNAEVRSGSGE